MVQLILGLIRAGLLALALNLDPSSPWYKLAWWYSMLVCWVFFLAIAFTAFGQKYFNVKSERLEPLIKNSVHAVMSVATAGLYLWLIPEAGIAMALALIIIFKGWIK